MMSNLGGMLSPGGEVLAVDDQPENLELLQEILTEEGFTVRVAPDGLAALAEVERQPPDCMVLDIMMPRLDGFGVCDRLKSRRDTHFIPILMLTALSDVEDKVRAFEIGADDFLNKPVNMRELVTRVGSLVKIKRLRDVLESSESIIVSMVQALESKDPNAAGHSERVADTAVRLANCLLLGPEQVELVAKGAILHDIGKIGLPDRVLWLDPGASANDVAEYRRHPALGEHILSPFLSFAAVRAVVRHHHERRNGSGFPDGLAGEELDLATEIVALANVSDVLASRRLGPEGVAKELREFAARGDFDRDLVEIFLKMEAERDARATRRWPELLALPGPVRPGRILLGCDRHSNQETLEGILGAEGHGVVCVDTGEAVLEGLDRIKPDLVLVDARMPGRSGFEVCGEIKGRPETEFLPVIVMTPQHDLSALRPKSSVGADDFLVLPVNRLELVARVKSLLRLRRYSKDLEEHQSVLLSLAAAIEAKDPYTRGHSERVGALAALLGESLGLPEAECRVLRVAGQLHDIGKIGMPESLLHKQGRLDAAEFEEVMRHPAQGELICRSLHTLQTALPLIRHHHERLDGSGYPDKLRGEKVAIGACILGLVDAFDALTSARSYRRNFSIEDALDLLGHETRAGRWDPKVYAMLVSVVRQRVAP